MAALRPGEVERTAKLLGIDLAAAQRNVEQRHALVKRLEQQQRQAAEDCRQRWNERQQQEGK